jgi:hypothetical protein
MFANIIRRVGLRRIRWEEYVAPMGGPRRRWMVNIQMDVCAIELGVGGLTGLDWRRIVRSGELL